MNIGAQWPTRKEAEATVLRTQTKLHRWAGERSPVDRLRSWRAGCSGTGTSGSEGGLRKRAGATPVPRRRSTFLIHTQNGRRFGRVQIEPGDVPDLVHEQRVAGDLEGVGAVRLKFERMPDALYAAP